MIEEKKNRILEIFYRAFRGEDLSVRSLADQYEVSTKSISRDINDIKAFLSEHRDLVGNTELEYCYQNKVYRLNIEDFLSEKELFALVKVVLGARAFSQIENLNLIQKLRNFATRENKDLMNEFIQNELYNYKEVKHDCSSVLENLWKLTNLIKRKNEITIRYFKINRDLVERRICPVSIMFTEYYFYLIAFKADDKLKQPYFFRVDRIIGMTQHREKFTLVNKTAFNESNLRQRCQFMFSGKLRTIRFEFSGPSVQAVLDRLPTAKIIEKKDGKFIIEAEVFGDGIKMYLLSQGSWVKVTSPPEFVNEMREEVSLMIDMYN